MTLLAPSKTRSAAGTAAALAGTATLAALAIGNHLAARWAERRHPPRGAFMEVDGVRLHYSDRGEGSPFHRLGELRDRTAEDMAHRASGLNLVVNAIVLWNTTYLARAVAYVRSQGVELTNEELSHVAPVRWDHIALTGDYLWSDVEAPREQFRSLRTSRFRPEAFRAALAA